MAEFEKREIVRLIRPNSEEIWVVIKLNEKNRIVSIIEEISDQDIKEYVEKKYFNKIMSEAKLTKWLNSKGNIQIIEIDLDSLIDLSPISSSKYRGRQ